MIDIAVIGLGTMGSFALAELTRLYPDKKVVGFEQYGGVHSYGAYTGESRLFRVAAKEGELFTPALIEAHKLWREYGELYGSPILEEVGALSIGHKDQPELATTFAAAEEYGLSYESFTAEELRARYPQFYIEDTDIGFLDLNGGALHPEVAVAAAQKIARNNGAELHTNTRVENITYVDSGVKISTSAGEFEAEKIILTAGPWLNLLAPELSQHLKIKSFPLLWFMPEDVSAFTPDKFPGFMRDLPGMHSFGVPALDGFSIKHSPNIELPEVDSWEDRHQLVPRDLIERAIEEAVTMIPGIIPEPVRVQVHSDSITPDRRPVIDTLEGGKLTVLTGFSGNGFKFAPIWGRVAAQLAVEGSSPWQREEFRADRFSA